MKHIITLFIVCQTVFIGVMADYALLLPGDTIVSFSTVWKRTGQNGLGQQARDLLWAMVMGVVQPVDKFNLPMINVPEKYLEIPFKAELLKSVLFTFAMRRKQEVKASVIYTKMGEMSPEFGEWCRNGEKIVTSRFGPVYQAKLKEEGK